MRRIFLLSLILHGIVLTLLPSGLFQSRESISAAKEVQATLVMAGGEAKPVIEKPVPAAPKPVVSHHPPATHRESPRNVPILPAVSPAHEVSPRAEAIAANSSANPAATAPPAAAPANAPPRMEPPADGLREYRLALGREARRFKQEFDRKYDAMERERQRGWEGRVEMTVRLRAGLSPAVVLAHSSGFPALDEQALELMGKAVHETAIPPSLQGQALTMPVMLEFRIRQE